MKMCGFVAGVVALVSFLWSGIARADCPPNWTQDFPAAYSAGAVNAMVVFNGELYCAGAFTNIGGIVVNRIARYDGHTWRPLGNGLNSTVTSLIVHNDGTGPALYAGGAFTASGAGAGAISLNRVGKWNGTTWSALTSSGTAGVNSTVNAMAVYNGQLVVGGSMTQAGGTLVSNVASWNGTTWAALATGLNATVNTLGTFTEGANTRLYAGGVFSASGATPNLRAVARWDGTAWTAAGQGFTGASLQVNALAFFNGSIYAGGIFSNSGINSLSNIARWTGTQWVDVGGGVNSTVFTLSTQDDGSGPKLFVGGSFTSAAAGTVTSARFLRWNGVDWLAAGAAGSGANSNVLEFASYNDGTGTKIYLGGQFTAVGEGTTSIFANGLATWNGQFLSPAGKGPALQPDALGTVGSGATAKLAALGNFVRVGSLKTSGVALYDGANWSTLGTEPFDSSIYTIADYNGSIYVGGQFTGVGADTVTRFARWTGTAWVTTGAVNSTIVSSLVHNGLLYIAGAFTAPAARIASYNGTTFTALGTGLNNTCNALASYNGQLIAGGAFTNAGGATANRIAAWNGSAWTPLGNGLNNTVRSMAVLGNELFVAGDFTTAGVASASRVARWNGTTWRDAAGGMDASVTNLVVVDSGGSRNLYAIGSFTVASGAPAFRVARWNGCRWVPVGGGFELDPVVTPTPTSMAGVNTGNAAGLYIGGNFVTAGGNTSANFLVRAGICFDCPTDFDDGTGTGHADGGVTIDDLIYYLGVFEAGDPSGDIDDGSTSGACDGGVTIEDLIYFLIRFEAGC